MHNYSAFLALYVVATGFVNSQAFILSSERSERRVTTSTANCKTWLLLSATVAPESSASISSTDDLAETKAKLMELVRPKPFTDPILADPITKEALLIESKVATIVESASGRKISYVLTSANGRNTYTGSSDSYINLLEPTQQLDESTDAKEDEMLSLPSILLRSAAPFLPPQFRFAIDRNYIPMRDLFTSPAVSFAYERGWRQGFRQAGFPGPDKEAFMAMEYFEKPMSDSKSKVIVDMSCATGLFTRRFTQSGKYKRVLGCDYSDSMLQEARRRINREWQVSPSNVELIRLDVGQIPMQNNSIDALHAGAAMHCWPDLPAAVSEIDRVLKPGGRYFASTFLSSYFSTLQSMQGDAGPSRQAFQYFGSVAQLRELIEQGGFAPEKVSIEVIGTACVVIRCEK